MRLHLKLTGKAVGDEVAPVPADKVEHIAQGQGAVTPYIDEGFGGLQLHTSTSGDMAWSSSIFWKK